MTRRLAQHCCALLLITGCAEAPTATAPESGTSGPAVDADAPSDTPKGDDPTGTTQDPPEPTWDPASAEHGTFLWRGFEHAWLRAVVGFRIPHRISRLTSFVDGGDFSEDSGQWSGTSSFHFGQSTGVDGNFMKPVGRYQAVYSPDIVTHSGSVNFTFEDESDGGEYPKAESLLSQVVSIDLSAPELALGQLDNYAVVLGGLELETACDDAKQPADNQCNSDGMWPYRFGVDVLPCQRQGDQLECVVKVDIGRGWTPNKGGVPPFEIKPFNDVLDFDLTVHYTVLGGNESALRVTHAPAIFADGKGRDNDPAVTSNSVDGLSGAAAITALTGFGFELYKTQSLAKHNHLGRYIGELAFGLQDGSRDGDELDFSTISQLWVPDTVEQTGVTYRTSVALLEFEDGNAVSPAQEVTGSLCIPSSPQAPAFSAWNECGNGNKGPEQDQDTMSILAHP